MGWRKKSRKLFKGAKKLAMLDPGTKFVAGAIKKQSSSDDDEPRAEAAAQLVKKSATRQGGGGQVNFTTEVFE